MSDEAHEAKLKRAAQMREFPQTMAIMERIRDAMAAQVFVTKLGDVDMREALYLRVQTLDAMMEEMATLLRDNAGQAEIDKYVKELATSEE